MESSAIPQAQYIGLQRSPRPDEKVAGIWIESDSRVMVRYFCNSFVLVVALLFGASTTAEASPPRQDAVVSEAGGGLTPAQWEQGYADLVAALEADGAESAGGVVRYRSPGGVEVALPALAESPQNIWGGKDRRGIYISFNRRDQGAILAGAGGGLAVAICAVPGVGWVACAVASGLVAAAWVYLADYGRCRKRRPSLRVYLGSRQVRCARRG